MVASKKYLLTLGVGFILFHHHILPLCGVGLFLFFFLS